MAKPIIIAEDEEHLGALVKFKLERAGYVVQWLKNGDDAWKALAAGDAALAILDVMMPGMNGFQVLERMRADERTRDLPVIMLTARGQESDVLHGLKSGASEYIIKPFRPAELLLRVQRLLEPEALP